MRRLLLLLLMLLSLEFAHAGTDPRLQQALSNWQQGQTLTVAVIGGSITTGYAASPPRQQGWAGQLQRWLLAQPGRGKLSFINAGVSGTDSAAAVQRLDAHVLDAQPDLVIVEFGVNDEWLDPATRRSSYEGLIRRLLSAPKPAAVLSLHLTQQGNQARGALEEQLRIARHYGLTQLDFGAWMQARVAAGQGDWGQLYDEPVHPNQRGHDAIAAALFEVFTAALAAPPGTAPPLPFALHGRDHEFTRTWAGDQLQPYVNRGFTRGGEVHPEWPHQQAGWVARTDDATASFLVWGRQIAVFHAESEHYRNLEAWVDDGPVVTLRGQVPERRGYLGWSHTPVGRDLEPGPHLLHVRVKRDEWQGSGRPASMLAVMAAGLQGVELQHFDFERKGAGGAGLIGTDAPELQYIGRMERKRVEGQAAVRLSWSGNELRARFTGESIAFSFEPHGVSYYTVWIDQQPHRLHLRGERGEWVLSKTLPPGAHELRLVKRTEGSQGDATLLGLRLSPGGRLLPPPPARPLRLVVYGDSITAGACNGDLGADQYEDLSTHDGTRAYGAITAERLGADYFGQAVSGIGLTATWHDMLQHQVWDRVAPRLDAPIAPPDPVKPEIVVINLGQNDHGFPNSMGQKLSPEFGARYLDFLRQVRQRHPGARLVIAVGGMTAWKDEPRLAKALDDAYQTLRAEGDPLVWRYNFQAFAYAHPRIDVHAQMADELTHFLRTEVLK